MTLGTVHLRVGEGVGKRDEWFVPYALCVRLCRRLGQVPSLVSRGPQVPDRGNFCGPAPARGHLGCGSGHDTAIWLPPRGVPRVRTWKNSPPESGTTEASRALHPRDEVSEDGGVTAKMATDYDSPRKT